MTVTVRPIEARDESAWRRLWADYGVFYKAEFTEPQTNAVWTWLLDPNHLTNGWVAELDGDVVGFALMRSHSDTFAGGPAWYLDDLYVDPAARGHGAATSLITAIRAHADANGGGSLSWITADDNLTAQSVYNKLAVRRDWVTYEMEG